MTSTTTAQAVLTIGGQPQPGGAASYPVHNPARPAEVVGRAPAADRDQVDAAVQAARQAAAGWRALGVTERVAAVAAAATTAAQQFGGDGAPLYTREHGKVLSEARLEIDTAPAVASVLGSMAEPALAPEKIDPRSPCPRLHREPYGVAALILPFSWPLAVMMTKLTSALAAGNTAVVKVPPSCPLAALQLGAAIIAPDISVTDQLIEHLVAATYTTCGQVCMAIKRLYAPTGSTSWPTPCWRAASGQ